MHQYAFEDIEGTNYSWDMVATDDGGVLMVGDVTPNSNNYQDVWLVKVDSNGCIQNDCEKTLVYDVSASVEEPNVIEVPITFYLNPNTGSFEIHGLAANSEYNYKVSNLKGQLVAAGNAASTTLVLEDLNAGVYFLSIFQSGERLTTQKLVIHD
jgi:hypothetical protein